MSNRESTILIVDDNLIGLDSFFNHLYEFGFKLVVTESGSESIQQLNHIHQTKDILPNLILLDVKMINHENFEVCRYLKSQAEFKDIPIIFMTAPGDLASKLRGFEMGASDYLVKPIELTEAMSRIQTHLTLRQLQTNLQDNVKEQTAELESEIVELKRYQSEWDEFLQSLNEKHAELQRITETLIKLQEIQLEQLLNSVGDDVNSQINYLQENLQEVQTILGQIEWQPSKIMMKLSVDTADVTEQEGIVALSRRELEVLRLILSGKNSQEIGRKLSLSENTIRTYRYRIMQKTHTNNTADLVKLVLKHKLFE